MMATGAEFDVVDVGYMGAKALENAKELRAGEEPAPRRWPLPQKKTPPAPS